jgi:sec-independent protein translocase protein TatC
MKELRLRLAIALLSSFFIFLCSWMQSARILNILTEPLRDVASDLTLHFMGPLDAFWVQIRISVFLAFWCGLPFWGYQVGRFLAPALTKKQVWGYFLSLLFSSSLALAGMVLCWYFVAPIGLSYFIHLGMDLGAPMIGVCQYFDLIITMLTGFAIVFQTPLILIVLGMLGIVNHKTLAKHRRIAILVSLILGAFLTPPDVLTQVALAIPLYAMFELSLFILSCL